MKTKKILLTAMAAATMMTAASQVNSQSAEGYLTRAELMLRDSNYAGCIDQVGRARRLSLDTEGVRRADYMQAMAAAELGRAEAQELLENFLTTYPAAPERYVAQMGLAGLLYDRGDYASALKRYRSIPYDGLDSEKKAEYCEKSGYCLLKLGDYDEALRQFDRLSVNRSKANTARFYQGYVAYAKGDYERAAELFKKVNTESAPGNMADYYLSQIYFARGDYGKALTMSRKLLKNAGGAEPEFVAEAERIAGESLYHQGNDSQAIEHLKRYVAANPEGLPSAYYILGMSEYRSGDYAEAINCFSRVTGQENAMGQSAYLFIGQSYLKEGNVDAATLALTQALRKDYDPEVSETAFYNYGVAKTRGGRVPFGSSVTTFEEFLQKYPKSQYAPKVQEYVVTGYLTDNDYERALSSIMRIGNPSEVTLAAKQQVLYTLGSRDLAAGNVDRALTRLREAKSLGALNADVYRECDLWIGEALYRKGDYSGAAKSYQNYLNGLPKTAANRPLALYDLGYARFGAKRFDDALIDFNRYLNAPGNTEVSMRADAHNRLGDCHYYASDFARAAAEYDKAYKLAPTTGDYALYQKALMRGLSRDHNGKVAGMQKMMEEFPKSGLVPSALLEMAESYGELGDKDRALSTYKKLVADYPSTVQCRQGYLLLAITYMDRGNRDKAVESYKTVLKNYPSSEEARVAADDLKRIYSDMGRLDEFAQYVNTIPGAPRLEAAEVERLTFQSAEKEYTSGGGAKRLEQYVNRFPQGADVATALQYLAEDAAGRGDDKKALAFATRIVEEYPDSRAIESALAIKGDVEYKQGKGEMALSTYRQLEQRASSATSLNQARLGVLKASRDLNRHKDVVEQANELLGSSTVSGGEKEDVTFARGYAYMQLGESAKAVKDFESLATDLDKLNGAKSAYYLGQLYYDEGKLKKARKAIERLVEANPPHHYWLARGFIVLSDINRKEGNSFEADEYLKTLKENYPGSESDIFEMIESRLK